MPHKVNVPVCPSHPAGTYAVQQLWFIMQGRPTVVWGLEKDFTLGPRTSTPLTPFQYRFRGIWERESPV